jgi:hypothetical protein
MNPTELHYSDIHALVQSTEQKATRLACVFACPISAKTQKATVDIVQANDSIATKAKARLRGAAIKSLTRSASRGLRSLFGNNAVGRLASELATDKGKAAGNDGGFSDEELQRAIVVAFDSVQAQFAWDDERPGWVHKSVIAEKAKAD